MSIGYACVHIGSAATRLYSLRLKNASPENIFLVTAKNLDALDAILDYNIENRIRLFRISSDIVPLGSHPANTLDWRAVFASRLETIGQKIAAHSLRVSMHPGQYTVLNATHPAVASRAADDLMYHTHFLDALSCDSTCKIVLHIGGVYGDKPAAKARFIRAFEALPASVQGRLVIENDDKSFNIADVLDISSQTDLPVVFDNLHHALNPPKETADIGDWLSRCARTWRTKDGIQKIHYSESAECGVRGAHSATISADSFLKFYQKLPDRTIDMMLEVKDKNLSAVKCSLLAQSNLQIRDLEQEWARYKYWTLSRSSAIYEEIRALLKDKSRPDALAFYRLIEKAAALPTRFGAEVNAAQHVWGYLNQSAESSDLRRFEKLIDGLAAGTTSPASVKRFLFRLAQAQEQPYLLSSLYFYLD
jgi:UV DNA damage endonuclease